MSEKLVSANLRNFEKKKLKRVGKHSLGQIYVENSGPKTQKII